MAERPSYTDATYGDRIAERYDERYHPGAPEFAVEASTDLLAELAGSGPALELGIGTGRVALPLQERGVQVHGIDASEAMVAKLRTKPGGERIPVTMGSFSDFSLETRFRLVYVPFNTFFALRDQDEQLACFRAVARHLDGDGTFLIEAFVPDLTRFVRGQNVSATRVGVDEVQLDVSEHDALEQRVNSHHVILRDGRVELYPVRLRYAFCSELDLMARLAGLRLRDRWADWDRTPFTETSGKHVTIYELDR
jgi:SAM-dependent methyltransferase